MKFLQFTFLIACVAMLTFSCSPDQFDPELSVDSQIELRSNNGAIQISGVGYFADQSECDHGDQEADFALSLTGDLEGCLYVYVDEHECSPSGTYREVGREYFVGTYDGDSGTFWTNYRFSAKYEGCSDGFFEGAEIFGRCQHPIQAGTGTGVFEGVTGRIDFKDNVETGELPYRGHLKF